jgi:aspartyl-tRNA(Asn)/glutamyl-tRNA(Gln) amidotransferase subunit B
VDPADHSLVDYNRSGVPLVEIVSEPDLRSAAQARAYAAELRAILVASGASDGRMEEGSMRVDANVSVRPVGSAGFGTRCEVKNLNSLRSLARAIEYEAERQIALLSAGEEVVQETRHWDEEAGRTSALRSKEEAYDYRYFPEPDLVPVAPDQDWVAEVAEGLGAMPAERRAALLALLGPAPSGAQEDQVRAVVDQGLDDLVVAAAAKGADPALALARAANELSGLDETAARRLDPASFAALVSMESSGRLSATQAKTVLADLVAAGGGDPEAVAATRGFEALSTDSLSGVVDAVLAEHAEEWARYVAGDDKLAQLFIGQVMKATRGQADGKAVAAELRRRRG